MYARDAKLDVVVQLMGYMLVDDAFRLHPIKKPAVPVPSAADIIISARHDLAIHSPNRILALLHTAALIEDTRVIRFQI
ncbi:hypothetical protein D3C78_1584230 [compost metagenome]